LKRIGHRQDAERLARFSDQADFLPANLFVYSDAFLIDSSPPQAALRAA
jgi:hypothetical protein